jgi:hypothetical protein
VVDRHLAAAAAAFIAALVLAGGALVALGVRQPPSPATVVVAVPPPPSDEAVAVTGGAPEASLRPDAVEGPREPDQPSRASSDDGEPSELAVAPPVSKTVTAPSPPERVIVVATGIAWNDDLAAAAAFRLPSKVAFALPADLPTAVERLARWRAAGREVAVRFDWRTSAVAQGDAVPLAAGPGVQAGRMEEQWAALGAAVAAVVVEPQAAEALAPIARSLAASRDAPVLLGSDTPAPPPRAWRLDAGLLGERDLEDALARVAEGTAAGDTVVLLIEVYPALLDRLVAWLRGLEDRGIALVPVDTLVRDRS